MATVAAFSLATPLAVATDVLVGPYRYTGEIWSADPLPQQPKVPGGPVGAARTTPKPAVPKGARELRTHTPEAARWPGGSTATVDLGGSPATGRPKAGGTPVSVSAVPTSALGPRSGRLIAPVAPVAPLSSVEVRLADRSGARAAGVDGLLVGLARGDGRPGVGGVSVSLDYSSIEQAYGGGWASRLRLVALPGCALTTPQRAECRRQTPIEFTNDPRARTLSGTVAVASAARTGTSGFAAASSAARSAGATMAVAAVAGSGGSQGDYGATSLSASGAWTASASGAFTYAYPITVPPSLGGAAPAVTLAYDSQSVDGETSARNSQSSWIGDGWGYSPGFIERSYKACKDQGIEDSGDECWGGWNATISLGSHTGELLRDSSGGYRLQNDDGTRIERLTGATNGLWQGEYFKVTTTDGTAYYLGLNHAPGTTSDTATNSAWGVPVYHPKAEDPCHDSADGNDSRCDQPVGYRFNLDFAVDPHGNVQRYDWSTESNYYNMGYGQVAKDDKGGTLTQYTRGGRLTQISYGYQLTDAQAGREPAAKVVFNAAQRCTTSDTVCTLDNLSRDTATNWPDTPYDLTCLATDKNKVEDDDTDGVCLTGGPTFWSTFRLKSVDTKVRTGSGWQDVDSFELKQVFSDAGGTYDPVTGKTQDPTNAGALQSVMWLSEIVHTGRDTSAGGGGPLTLDPVTFTGIEMDNRVDGLSPAAPPLFHPRVSSIQTETGESVAVTYRAPECSREKNTMPASADANTMACYPVWWTTPGGKDPIEDWFHKTLVAQVTDSDRTKAGSPAKVTNYAYSDGAAWHRDDSDLTDDQHRTWNQFRGYRTVTTTTGAAPDPITQSVVSYLQGMDGDYKADGTRRTAKVRNSLNEEITDNPWSAGAPYETQTFTKAGGSVVAKTLADPPTVAETASAARTAWTSEDPAPAKLSTLPDLKAHQVRSTSARSLGLLSDGSWRTVQTVTTMDDLGRVHQVDEKGDLAASGQQTCTTTGYAPAPAANPMMLIYPSEVLTVAGPCGTTPGGTTTLYGKRFFYDGAAGVPDPAAYGVLGRNGSSLGLVTGTQSIKSYTAPGQPSYQSLGGLEYDKYGRVTKTVDAVGAATTTAYLPADGVLPDSLSTRNPLGWVATSTISVARGAVTHAVDVNGRITDVEFDALGRRTKVWTPGRSKATQSPDRKFGYDVHGAGDKPDPSAVTTETLRENGSYNKSVTYYDGLLRPRQSQTTTADNSAGRLVSSSFYDSHGWAVSNIAPYTDAAHEAGTGMWAETNNTGPSVTRTAYDGQGRPVSVQQVSFASTLWQSGTSYPGADRVDTTVGAARTTTYTDGLGRTTSTVVHDDTPDRKLTAGTVMASGTSVVSKSVRLAMRADGNLVLTGLADGRTLWSSGTSGNPGAVAVMQADGDFVVQNATRTARLWRSGTTGATGAYLMVRGDGVVAVSNASNAVVWSTGPAGAVGSADVTTSYTFDARGDVASVKDTAGNVWSYTYDLRGQLVSQTDPDSGTSVKEYDDLGRLARARDGRGQWLSYVYDGMGRTTAKYAGTSTTDQTKLLAEWSFDAKAKGYPDATTRYVNGRAGDAYVTRIDGYTTAYQPTGSTVTVPVGEGKLAGTYTTAASYTDTVGLLGSTTFGAAGGLAEETVGFGYNLQGGLVSMGSPTTPYVNTTSYSPLGQVLQTTIGTPTKQLRTAQTYDQVTGRLATNRVTLQTNTANPISDTTYGYDQVGNLTTVSETQSSGGADRVTDTQCFSYDALRRLTTAWTDTKGITSPTAGQLAACKTSTPGPSTIGGPAPYWTDWQYDLLGDRTLQVKHDVTGNAAKDTTQSSSYPVAGATPTTRPNAATGIVTSNPTTGTSTLTPTYDNAGNTTRRVGTGAAPLDQVISYDAEGATSGITTDGKETTYLYDADGALLLQRGPTSTTLYLFGGTEQLTLDKATKAVSALRYYSCPDGTTIVRASNGTISYQPTNPQGTAQLQVDAKTLAITRRAYDPYGNQRGPAPASWADNHGFLGKPADPTTGLDLLGARQYDPVLGRFLSVDPVFEAGDPNQMGGYTYAANNPVSGSDPTGLWWSLDDIGGFFTGVGDSVVGDPWQWSVNTLSDGWNAAADCYNGDNEVFNEIFDYENDTPYKLGHTGYVDDDPLAELFDTDSSSTAYVAGQWTGTIGSLAIDGVGLVKGTIWGFKSAKAIKLAMSEGDGFISAVRKFVDGDLPTTTAPQAEPAPTTPKTEGPSNPKSGTGKEPGEPGGGGKADKAPEGGKGSGDGGGGEPAATGDTPTGTGGTPGGGGTSAAATGGGSEAAARTGVSIKSVRIALGRAGMSVKGYDIVHMPKIEHPNSIALGNSPYTGKGNGNALRVAVVGPNKLPLIEISTDGLRDMETALKTILHELYHHKNGHMPDMEAQAEAYADKRYAEYLRRTKGRK
ncbi:RHS repeat-associated core domain-containing protein [Kitasatospora sp. NPDC001603]|uniref:RHS repeat-associated core domain-containing protein n=1 Tax=Kitasatospora sp. NPDC001603 TaxID=3154388 RepID=UPI003328E8C7